MPEFTGKRALFTPGNHGPASRSRGAERVATGSIGKCRGWDRNPHVRAGQRAWDAAMRSRVAADPAEVRQHAAEAITAAECALEADRRVSQVIAASLWAAEDRRHREQLEPAA